MYQGWKAIAKDIKCNGELEKCGMKTWIVEWNADKENHIRELNAWLVEGNIRFRIRVTNSLTRQAMYTAAGRNGKHTKRLLCGEKLS